VRRLPGGRAVVWDPGRGLGVQHGGAVRHCFDHARGREQIGKAAPGKVRRTGEVRRVEAKSSRAIDFFCEGMIYVLYKWPDQLPS